MIVELVAGKKGYALFKKIGEQVYKNNPYYRGTEQSIEKMLILGTTHFHTHAQVKAYILKKDNNPVARFALINNNYETETVLVSFFEALPGLGDVFSIIKNQILTDFPQTKKIVVGINGHLNYGAGFLLNHFDKVPVFGLPYTPEYYPNYLATLTEKRMYSFRFGMKEYNEWAKQKTIQHLIENVDIRFMNKSDIKNESTIYTQLNNQSFLKHPYWTDRHINEDIELFYPFRFLLRNENLIIASSKGKNIGFFLWYPDFNQLINSQRDFNAIDVLKLKLGKKIDTFRFTEIGIIPEFQNTMVGFAMILKALPYVMKKGYQYCEGGFIFEENTASIQLAKRMIERSFRTQAEPYRKYAVYECNV